MRFTEVLAAASLLIGSAVAASAASINFDDGASSGGNYFESGYVFDRLPNGAVSTPNGCVDGGVNSGCLLLPNQNSDSYVKMAREDGAAFNLLSFTFDGRDGQGPALYVSAALDGPEYLFSEFDVSNTMTASGALDQFMGVTMVFFRDAGTGSSRVDNINVTDVPLPAAGFMLLAGLGGLIMLRKRRS